MSLAKRLGQAHEKDSMATTMVKNNVVGCIMW